MLSVGRDCGYITIEMYNGFTNRARATVWHIDVLLLSRVSGLKIRLDLSFLRDPLMSNYEKAECFF